MRAISQEKDEASASDGQPGGAEDDSLPVPLSSDKSDTLRKRRAQRKHTDQVCERRACPFGRPTHDQLHANRVNARQTETNQEPENRGAHYAMGEPGEAGIEHRPEYRAQDEDSACREPVGQPAQRKRRCPENETKLNCICKNAYPGNAYTARSHQIGRRAICAEPE